MKKSKILCLEVLSQNRGKHLTVEDIVDVGTRMYGKDGVVHPSSISRVLRSMEMEELVVRRQEKVRGVYRYYWKITDCGVSRLLEHCYGKNGLQLFDYLIEKPACECKDIEVCWSEKIHLLERVLSDKFNTPVRFDASDAAAIKNMTECPAKILQLISFLTYRELIETSFRDIERMWNFLSGRVTSLGAGSLREQLGRLESKVITQD